MSIMNYKEKIARRAAREIGRGNLINLGIGIPTLISSFLSADDGVCIHSENGILGMGQAVTLAQADRNLIDAGGVYVAVEPGAAYFDSAVSFALVRSGRLDITFLGALEVSEQGDLANWIIPGKLTPGIGGAMELAQKAKRVIVTMTHTDRNSTPKIVQNCSLPLTAPACVSLIITELAVIAVESGWLVLRELAEGVSAAEVVAKTAAPLQVPDTDLPRF
ncbi:3-oxoacid CoA-transferase subunit B [Geopsychrobacter electrodiphilus]|uniref:3-oxoacid CoA-transferase subunit B n=1 Tax=Geopsychrobacter electrodiphilus TaxID=225196 RepID=UPI00036585D9|nr:3-oxoacid CoA-transferase subunit B [Geopsychrobacter electrodiphilus]